MNIILDCDPGHDDAIAILLLGSQEKYNVLGVTTTAGNQTIEKTNNCQNIISQAYVTSLSYNKIITNFLKKEKTIKITV